ncbi:MAG: NAD(P)H-dependent oxidoreductase subunit E [Chitinispirillia bacterium]|jgi:NADH:ubiquinone oxidoreductase subunit E
MAEESKLVEDIINRYDGEVGMLIPMLQDLQEGYGYLPEEQLRYLSDTLKIPLTRIFGVATFYSSFRLAPKGEHEVTICMGTVCHLKGAGKILDTLCEEFNVDPGGTTEDKLFTLQAVNCVGACALAPVMIVDGKYFDGVGPESAKKIIYSLSSSEKTAKKEAKK